jgi:hypothetical protein
MEEDGGTAVFHHRWASTMDGGSLEGVPRHWGNEGVRGKSQIKERPSMGGAHCEGEKMAVAALISEAPTCL